MSEFTLEDCIKECCQYDDQQDDLKRLTEELSSLREDASLGKLVNQVWMDNINIHFKDEFYHLLFHTINKHGYEKSLKQMSEPTQ